MVRPVGMTLALVCLLAAPAGAWVEDRVANPFAVYDNTLALPNLYRGEIYPNIDMVADGRSGTVRQISTESAWWGGSAGGVERTSASTPSTPSMKPSPWPTPGG